MFLLGLKELNKQKLFSTLSFSLFFGWLLSFPFEGQVLSSLLESQALSYSFLNLAALCAHFTGLITGGFIINKLPAAKTVLSLSAGLCLAGSIIFLFHSSWLWYLVLAVMAYTAGLVVAGWGFFFQAHTQKDDRLKTAANVLILSNILMILANILAINFSAYIGLGFEMLLLLGSFFLSFRLQSYSGGNTRISIPLTKYPRLAYKPLVILSIFIVMITINSGLMYRVVNPVFAEYKFLASYYWAVPYIVTLLILRNLSIKISKAYILYVAMIMIGLSFLSFMLLQKSVATYLLIDTLMLGAFGVCDLFFWSILGNLLDYYRNPALIFGMGLSMNVLGIILGGFVGDYIFLTPYAIYYAVILALFVIFSVLILLPVLQKQLRILLQSHPFIFESEVKAEEQKEPFTVFQDNKRLTGKETEIVKLLRKGYTYKAISEKLLISENTLKYHIKNIYQKLNINSKMELIKIFTDANS
ncbi:MAG: Transcriptional regulatory protein DegU [Candidatus Dichloromethanomonas elyunquensis]|nr:MAG: Transcriptional regulatory protein DegU [Candidatus Dichloromethanomonas elyunquensis]